MGQFSAEDASYEVRGGPLTCKIAGREAIFAGRFVVNIADGVIVALRDEYIDEEMERFDTWMLEHAEGLDGSYV